MNLTSGFRTRTALIAPLDIGIVLLPRRYLQLHANWVSARLLRLLQPSPCARKAGRGGDRQYYAYEGEGVAEAHDEGLTLDDIAERHDRLMLRGGGVGDAVRQEVVSR